MILILLLLLTAQSLDDVRKEGDPARRYLLALDAASRSLDAARASHASGAPADTKANLEQSADATDLSLQSLIAMGKPPFKNANNYKKAEMRTRDFLRRIEALRKDANFEDREALDSAFNRVNQIHETLIDGVMSKKR